MSTRIRLRRMGSKGRPFYRVVVADQRSPRDGRFIENIGKYHPLEDPSLIEIDEERALHWLRVGAQPSQTVRVLMNNVGIWEKFVAERPAAAKDSPRKRQRTSAPATREGPARKPPAHTAPRHPRAGLDRVLTDTPVADDEGVPTDDVTDVAPADDEPADAERAAPAETTGDAEPSDEEGSTLSDVL